MDIEIKNISFAYDNIPVIDDITCSFPRGGFHTILGPNGSGKTSLLDIISGFTRPEKGQILLKQIPLGQYKKREVAKIIALVSQNYAINFPFTVEEVIMMGRHPHIDRFSHPTREDLELVKEFMELTGIAHLANRRITELSGGEKQRCVFTRALCQDAPILLLDEAFSSMDISHTLQLLTILKKEMKEKQKTIIAVLHDLNLAAVWSDTILFLKNGKIEAMGATEKVFTHEIIKTVFNVNAKVEFNDYARAKQAYFQTQ